MRLSEKTALQSSFKTKTGATLDLGTVEISSTRLVLKSITSHYEENIFREHGDSITTYLPYNPPAHVSEVEMRIYSGKSELSLSNKSPES